MFCDGHSDFCLLALFERLALDLQIGSSLLGGHPRIKRGEGHREIVMRLSQVGANLRGFRIVFKGFPVLPFVVQYFPQAHFSFRHVIMQSYSLGIMILRSGEVLIRFSLITKRSESLSRFAIDVAQAGRSEEHTSELQSPCNLVCRLLLEKNK